MLVIVKSLFPPPTRIKSLNTKNQTTTTTTTTQDRVDYIEVTPSVSRLAHARVVAFMAALLALDCAFLQHTVAATLASGGHSVQLLFAFEYVILASAVVAAAAKYAMSAADAAMEGRWDGKVCARAVLCLGRFV